MKTRIVFLIMFSLLFTAGHAEAGRTCDSCHPKSSFPGKNVHKPVAQGKCTQCHNPHVAKFEGLLQKQGGDLCYSCHDRERKTFKAGVMHQPVYDGECLACHSAHASDQKGLLSRPLAESCFNCHKPLAEKEFAVRHKPFDKGNCVACHQPHNADNFQLLKKDSDALCLGCHAQPGTIKGHAGFPGKVGECLTCHSPHGSSRKGLIRENIHAPYKEGCASCHDKKNIKSAELCLSCHAGVREQMLSPHSHMFAGDDGCVECHSPHASDTVGLLKAPDKQLCRSCHTNTFERNRISLHPHPETEKCTDCHAAHGSNRHVMLNADGNALCSRCHETQGEFSHPVGVEIVDHRTGQSMTCLSCHDPMGTEYRYHLKLSGKKALCVQCHRSY